MAFFDRMKDSLTTAGQEVSQKAKNATENVRLGNLIKNNDKMVDKLLYQVGLKYYEAHGQEEGTEYQELFAGEKWNFCFYFPRRDTQQRRRIKSSSIPCRFL